MLVVLSGFGDDGDVKEIQEKLKLMRKLILGSMLIASSIFTFPNTANANSVQNEINSINRTIRDVTRYERRVLNPAVRKNQRYLNWLYRACMNGNMNACSQYNIRIRRQNKRLKREIQRIRNRRRY